MLTLAKRFLFFSVFSSSLTFSVAVGDDHVVFESVRSALGTRSPARTTEIWMSDDALSMNSGRLVTIVRYDLQKRWRYSPQTRRYVEEPLVPFQVQKKDSVTIQRTGWDYVAQYDWIVSEKDDADTINGRLCKMIVADGDADYSTEVIQFWVTSEIPFNIERFNERVTAAIADFDWPGIIKVLPSLKNLYLMKISDRKAHPIAPEMTYETSVTKIETASPPPGVYEIPAGFQKVNSIDDLLN